MELVGFETLLEIQDYTLQFESLIRSKKNKSLEFFPT
jgi:hypothetical protein